MLKVGQEVTARVIKIDKSERRIGLSIKAATYSTEQLKAEQAILDSLKPGEDLVALQHAFDAADESARQQGSNRAHIMGYEGRAMSAGGRAAFHFISPDS